MILDKGSYITVIEEILNGNSKFSKPDITAGKEINPISNLEKSITSELKLLKSKEIIDKSTSKSIKPEGSRPDMLYGLGKIPKEARNWLPPFRPTLSAIGTPTYKLAKFLLKFLTPSAANKYIVIDSFHFAEEAWDVCVDNLYNDNENLPNIPKLDFRNLATKESFFTFNNKYYKQVGGVAIGTPLGPTWAKISMYNFESKWIRDCPNDLKPVL